MTDDATLSRDGRTITVHVPLTIRRRGGRKLIVAPDGSTGWAPPRARVDNAMVKAVARAFRWRRLLEEGKFGSVTELADAEKINKSYVSRVLRLSLLAPDIVEAILAGRQPATLGLPDLFTVFPVEWEAQRRILIFGKQAQEDDKCTARPPAAQRAVDRAGSRKRHRRT